MKWLSLLSPRVDAREKMQKRSFCRWERDAGSEEESEKRERSGLVLLMMFMVSSVWRERAR